MTINDLYVSEQLSIIHREEKMIEGHEREGRENALFMALSDIERAAHRAQNRLNEMRLQRGAKSAAGLARVSARDNNRRPTRKGVL